MVYPLSYRRPERVSRASSVASLSGENKQISIRESVRSGSSGMSHGIPDALSFDRIIAGGVCPVSPLELPTSLESVLGVVVDLAVASVSIKCLVITKTNSSAAVHGARLHELPQVH